MDGSYIQTNKLEKKEDENQEKTKDLYNHHHSKNQSISYLDSPRVCLSPAEELSALWLMTIDTSCHIA